jgi:carboxylate-amine ligase
MTGQLVDLPGAVGSGRLADAWDLVDALVAQVQPALDEAGDEERIRMGLKAIRAGGTGAQRQRAAADTGGIVGALDAARVSR